MAALDVFSPRTRAWFEGAFAEPTPAQELGWPAIASGEHTLIQAPTGSGKTLAAFLYGIDRLTGTPGDGIRLLYVSPLKALNYDIERNLRGPLAGLESDLRVAVRTGDTPQRERAAMLREPPDILITTPESLFLLLTSRARETLRGVETLVLDEVHAVAGTKRGAHLALSVERLDRLTERPVQRIGLSATQRPLEEIGRFVSGGRPIRLVDAGRTKELDLQVVVPLEDMREPGAGPEGAQILGTGSEGTPQSIWPSIYPEILRLVEEHRSTIVFVNNRRLAERLALRLNELAEREIARAHHGSLAREQRGEIEELLKAGQIPCLVATSSLELGIDMGAVDLVIQVESPKSVARGLQGVRRLAVTNAGTIPDRGLFGVHLVDGGGRVGELDEEMVYEARAGQTFLLGASTWRIEEITRDRVLVSPAPGVPGAVPFWKGEGVGRPYELGAAVGQTARALLIPRRRPGQRTPLWQQRLKAQGLLQVARRYGSFPVILETYRECLQDVFDLPSLKRLLQGLRTREIDLVDVETASASPYSASLLFDYIATYMYEDDTPPAERRAQALSLDRDLLRELLGQEELRDLLDGSALEEVEAQLRGEPRTPDELHDKLRLRGDLRAGEYDDALARPLLDER